MRINIIGPVLLFAFLTIAGTWMRCDAYDLGETLGNPIPESPRAAKFAAVEMPVPEMSTGATRLDIPLYGLNCQGLTVDFALNYLSNGIRADEDPCPISYGWSFTPSLRVTRRIMGRPDELYPFVTDVASNIYYPEMFKCVTDSGLFNRTDYPPSNRYDPAHDIYTIHIADASFVCVADFSSGAPKFSSVGNSEYRVEADCELSYIKVTDTKGNKYMFGKRGEYYDNDLNCTEWLLTEIELLSGDKIEFTWTKLEHTVRNRRMPGVTTLDYAPNDNAISYKEYSWDEDNPLIPMGDFHNAHELSAVRFPGGTIALTYALGNKGPHLTCFKVSNTEGATVRDWTLGYDGQDMLTNLTGIDGGRHDFEYYTYIGATDYGRDLWGYCNGESTSALVPQMSVRPDLSIPLRNITGASRATNIEASKHRLLRKVTYPTGGTTEWTHEAHQFIPVECDGKTKKYINDVTFSEGGGLRVSSIVSRANDGDSSPRTRYYKYGNNCNGIANCIAFPYLHTFVTQCRNVLCIWPQSETPGSMTSVAGTFHEYDHLTINTTSNYLNHHVGTTPIWYSKVTEIDAEGMTEHYFEDLLPADEVARDVFTVMPQVMWHVASRGIRETKTTYYRGRDDVYKKIRTDSCTYKVIYGKHEYLTGHYIHRKLTQSQSEITHLRPDFGENGVVLVDESGNIPYGEIHTGYYYMPNLDEVYQHQRYILWLAAEQPVARQTTMYYDNGAISTGETYKYVDDTGLQSRIDSRLSDGTSQSLCVQYIDTSTSVGEKMHEHNMQYTPVRLTVSKPGGTTESVECEYGLVNNNIPRIKKLNVWRGGTLKTYTHYTYDKRGCMTRQLTADSIEITWQWDNAGLYPIKQTIGGDLETTYKWKTLVGLTSITEPSGLTTEYTYDAAGRLVSDGIAGLGKMHAYAYNLGRGASSISVKQMLSANADKYTETVAYYDGLGREWLKVQKGIGSGNKDVATLTEYDIMWRPSRQWSPAPLNVDAATDATAVVTAAKAYYGDDYCYVKKQYEESTSGKLTGMIREGSAWHKSNKHRIYNNLTNDVASGSRYRCPQFVMNSDCSVTHKGNYPAGTLYVEEITDGDGKSTLTFVNARGNMIMTRNGVDGDWHDTRYIYNDYDNLVCVLPPMLEEKNYGATDQTLMAYAYFYKYDSRGNCVEKKLAGRDAITLYYDPSNRLVAEYHGSGSPIVYGYDKCGRLVLTATANAAQSELQLFAQRLNRVELRGQEDTDSEYKFLPYDLFQAQTQIADYYDNYDFTYLCENLENASVANRQNNMGLKTGSSAGKGKYTVYYYDEYCRQIQRETNAGGRESLSTFYNYDSTVQRERSELMFRSKPYILNTLYSYDMLGRLSSVDAETDTVANGLVQIGKKEMHADIEYDGIGVASKTDFGKSAMTVVRDCGGREVQRKYTIPLMQAGEIDPIIPLSSKGIDIGDIGVIKPGLTMNIIEDLKYAGGSTSQYNGNISARTFGDAEWKYTYDAHDRLVKAQYTSQKYPQENFSTEYAYDRHANLTQLKKHGYMSATTSDCGLIDNLSFSYNGNQVTGVSDYAEDPVYEGSPGFSAPDGMSTRTYDDKGNLRTDSGRGISRILYNWQDQPTEINFSDGHRISITYDGYGNKLQVDYMTAQPIVVGSMHINSYKLDSRTYYSHGRVFKQNVGNLSFLEMTSHPYGYFDGDGKPYYYLPDYQGNITMVTDNDGMVQSHNRYYPYGETITRFKASETSPSPKTDFGQRYKYGGKEYETMYGLNAYDFGPRHLSADLAVWASPDRRQDSYHNLSPYAYCAGNPIRYADPTGCDTIDVAQKNGVWEIQQSIIAQGDDIIRVEDVLSAIYSKNEQNKRVIALNLEITEDYAIGVLHVSGTNATFLYVVPGGKSSNVPESKRRIEDGVYPIDNTNGRKWKKPGLGGDVRQRGIRFHSGKGNLVAWTEGCFVLMEEYKVSGRRVFDTGRRLSADCSIAFDIALGGVIKACGNMRENTEFPNGVDKILELRSINIFKQEIEK